MKTPPLWVRLIAGVMSGMLLLSMTSCSILFPNSPLFSNNIVHSGLDEFSAETSSTGLTKHLIPQDLLTKYTYTEGDYHFFDNVYITEAYVEKVFLYLAYDESVYADAKQYCLDTFQNLSTENVKEYNGYVFAENLDRAIAYNEIVDSRNKAYPNTFVMFGYHDTLKHLVFIGFSCGDDHDESAALADTDFGAFLKEFYGEYYDFGVPA